MKLIITFLMSLLSFSAGSIYDFTVPGLEGKDINFSDFKGKKILIVNTASRCGLTPQYEGLEQLYKTYGKKLVIVALTKRSVPFVNVTTA
jgi:glutathione peroxidase